VTKKKPRSKLLPRSKKNISGVALPAPETRSHLIEINASSLRVKTKRPFIKLTIFKLPIFFCLLGLLNACATLGSVSAPDRINYANPPSGGTWLPAQRELVACETVLAARYMGDFGFFHPQCTQLENIGPRDYRVTSRELVQLTEGPMWLLNVDLDGKLFFVPIPWHDWL